MNSNEQSLGQAIEAFFRQHNLKDKWDSSRVINTWGDIVGEYIASHTTDIYFQNGILFVYLDLDALRNELGYAKGIIIQKLNEFAGRQLVTDLVLR